MTSLLSEFPVVWFRYIGDMSLLASVFILLLKIQKSRSCRGISFKTQALHLTVFLTRYLDLFFSFISWYNVQVKIILIGTSCYILYLMRYKHRPTYDPSIDTFKVEYLVALCLILGLVFNYAITIFEVLWSFSVFLDSVAMLPQLFMLQRTGEAGMITTHYVAALGAHHAFRLLFWVFRYATDGVFDPIRMVAGIVQFGLYLVFVYIYFTRVDSSQSEEKQSEDKHSEEKVSEKSAQSLELV